MNWDRRRVRAVRAKVESPMARQPSSRCRRERYDSESRCSRKARKEIGRWRCGEAVRVVCTCVRQSAS